MFVALLIYFCRYIFFFYTIAKSAYINFAFVCMPGVLDPRNKTGMVSGKTDMALLALFVEKNEILASIIYFGHVHT